MVKIYKNKNPNLKRLTFLFVVQIVLGVLPPVLFAVYVFYVQRLDLFSGYHPSVGVVFISIMVLSLIGYTLSSKRYSVLNSGRRGEGVLIKTIKKLCGDYTAFTNLPVRYRRNRSEIDLVLVGEGSVIIIEVKNHSGVIVGGDSDEKWIHRKYYRQKKIVDNEIDNPFKQIKRQREILKSILRASGIDIWIDNILFFSGNLSLRLDIKKDSLVALGEGELVELITEYKNKNKPKGKEIGKETLYEIVEVLKGL